MLIDLHTHTRMFSWDSELSPDDLIDLSKQAGLDGICFSEHDFFWDHDAVAELAKKHSFLVIPGVEINTEDGHVLCFGIQEYVFGMHRCLELAQHVRRAGGVMVFAHPYRRQLPWNAHANPAEYEEALDKAVRNPAFDTCAAVERFNGRGLERENEFAARLCDRLGVATTAGSDSHAPGDVGKCATEFAARIEGLDDLICELKAGRVRPVCLDGTRPD